MGCTWVDLGNGGTAIVCTRGKRPKTHHVRGCGSKKRLVGSWDDVTCRRCEAVRTKRRSFGDTLDERCPACRGYIVLRRTRYGGMWACINYPNCDHLVGCHKRTLQPLGRVADAETRRARRLTHALFDRLWTTRLMHRRAAYAWLRRRFGLPRDEAHIAMMDLPMLRKVWWAAFYYIPRRLVDVITARRHRHEVWLVAKLGPLVPGHKVMGAPRTGRVKLGARGPERQ